MKITWKIQNFVSKLKISVKSNRNKNLRKKMFFHEFKKWCLCSMSIFKTIRIRVAIGSDQKQFLFSDPTKNKNESDPIRRKKSKIVFDPIRFNPIRLAYCLIGLKRIGFSKNFASAFAIGSDFRPKMLPSDFRSDAAILIRMTTFSWILMYSFMFFISGTDSRDFDLFKKNA